MSSKQKILIVDDKRANLFALQDTLKSMDAEVVAAESGNEALAATLVHDFALGILDVRMPEMDGYELAEILRADEKTHTLPIIFLTADPADERELFKGYESGAVDYIVKPYHPQILLGKTTVFLELGKQRQQLQRQQKMLEEANKELEAFSYSVSHDLRAPLRVIDSFSGELLKKEADGLGETERHMLSRIKSQCERMNELIDGLLQLSRIGRTDLRVSDVDLSAMAESIIASLREKDGDRNVAVVIQPNVTVRGDEVLLRIVLENLLQNAWKYTGKREEPSIEFGIDSTEKMDCNGPVCFLRDNGAGFDMKYADKLFAVFQRLHAESEFEGIGIGLSTVQRIIRRHGGRVWAKGERDSGACFFFCLPDEDI